MKKVIINFVFIVSVGLLSLLCLYFASYFYTCRSPLLSSNSINIVRRSIFPGGCFCFSGSVPIQYHLKNKEYELEIFLGDHPDSNLFIEVLNGEITVTGENFKITPNSRTFTNSRLNRERGKNYDYWIDNEDLVKNFNKGEKLKIFIFDLKNNQLGTEEIAVKFKKSYHFSWP